MKEPTELYIHIPFCVRKCRYCDFLSFPCAEEERKRYLEALVKEISLRSTGAPVRSVFLGGGTPSILPGEDIARIMDEVRRHFMLTEDCEITVECNPGTVTADKACLWKAAGINRVSMGVQSFDDGLLKRLGRIHTADEARDSFRILRDASFANLSMDLMMGLPGQSLCTWEKTLREAVVLAPEHLSCYSLIVEEGTPFFDDERAGLLDLPSDEEERAMYHFTQTYLAEEGYQQYEISNFAKPGYSSVHNAGYWERVPYLGLGLGAASLVRTGEGDIRFRNTQDLETYLNFSVLQEIEEEKEYLTEQEAQEEFMFLGLRKTEGVSETEFEREFGQSIRAVYGPVIADNVAKGLLTEADGRLCLSRRGTDLGNLVFASFLQD